MRTPTDVEQILKTAFERIQKERMQDVPILNDALHVEAVGFERHDAGLLGVLITPWFMNLMLLPEDDALWQDQPSGETTTVELPVGQVEFIAGREDGVGQYRMCSLFSPVFEFGDQATAVATAEAVMDGLLRPDAEAGTESEAEPMDTPPPRSLSRRELFRSLAGAE